MKATHVQKIENKFKEIRNKFRVSTKDVGELALMIDDFLEKLTFYTMEIRGNGQTLLTGELLDFLQKELLEEVHETLQQEQFSENWTSTGWLSPTGTYFATTREFLHEATAQKICEDSGVHVEYPQEYLMKRGWIRFDYWDFDFDKRPTEAQVNKIQLMYDWRIDHLKVHSSLDQDCYEMMGRFLRWCNDPTASAEICEEFEEMLEK